MPRLLRLIALTSCACGLQIIWSILMSSGTPFLISIGFDGASTALVWSISPICGTFVQPWVGALSDKYQWRRKTLLIGGAVAMSICLVGFSLSPSQVLALASQSERQLSDNAIRISCQIIATIWFCLLNISIQPIQMASRAIIIENNKPSDQVAASAWASRMQGVGSILGFLLGSLPLVKIVPDNLATNFTILCLFGSALLLLGTLISTMVVEEDLLLNATSKLQEKRPRRVLKGLITIPREIWQIFAVQFFAWLGWFPFRTYYTSWLSDIYAMEVHRSSGQLGKDGNLQSRAARLGSIAGIYLSIITLIANFTLPSVANLLDRFVNKEMISHIPWKSGKTSTRAILQIWLVSHLYFAFVVLYAGMIGSNTGAVLIISSLGISWAVTLWVPFCLIGLVLSRQHEERMDGGRSTAETTKMGAVVGSHNAAISAPQILSAFVCSIVFQCSETTTQGTLLVLLSGGCWTLIAAITLWIFFTDLQRL